MTSKRELAKLFAYCMLTGDEDLEDIRENVDTPFEQLSETGQSLVRVLHRNDIVTREQVDEQIKDLTQFQPDLLDKMRHELDKKMINLIFY